MAYLTLCQLHKTDTSVPEYEKALNYLCSILSIPQSKGTIDYFKNVFRPVGTRTEPKEVTVVDIMEAKNILRAYVEKRHQYLKETQQYLTNCNRVLFTHEFYKCLDALLLGNEEQIRLLDREFVKCIDDMQLPPETKEFKDLAAPGVINERNEERKMRFRALVKENSDWRIDAEEIRQAIDDAAKSTDFELHRLIQEVRDLMFLKNKALLLTVLEVVMRREKISNDGGVPIGSEDHS